MDEYEFDFSLERVETRAPARRGDARLLVLERRTGRIRHERFAELEGHLRGRSVYVNNSALAPRWMELVRLPGFVEYLYFHRPSRPTSGAPPRHWIVYGSLSPEALRASYFSTQGVPVTVTPIPGESRWFEVEFAAPVDVEALGCYRLAPDHVLLPRERLEERPLAQALYARVPGSYEAPTAGVHFDQELLDRLGARELTLHTSPGAFYRVEEATPVEHRMPTEEYLIPEPPRTGEDVVAIGTTVAKALEAWSRTGARKGESDLFIYPPFDFQVVRALLTNFHFPRQTLLLMTCAFGGREAVMEAHREAAREGYRFSSYGDLLLIT